MKCSLTQSTRRLFMQSQINFNCMYYSFISGDHGLFYFARSSLGQILDLLPLSDLMVSCVKQCLL